MTATSIVTAPAAEDSSPPSYTSDSAFTAAVVNSTNVYRTQHNASALAWNTSLAAYAQNWANGCAFHHSGGPYGENLAAGFASPTLSIDAWGNERALYNFASPGFSESTGHFTQLVWKATTATGCGRTHCDGRNGVPGWYLVCEYWPPGNVGGGYEQNVQGELPGSAGGGTSTTASLAPTGGFGQGGRGGGASDGNGNDAASGARTAIATGWLSAASTLLGLAALCAAAIV